MNNYKYIKVTNNIKRFIDKCSNKKINLYDIKYISTNELIVKINNKDFKKIKRNNYYSDIIIYKNTGLDLIKEKLNKNKYLILIFIICIFLNIFISKIIIKIDVIHSNKKIRELVLDELDNNNIKLFSYKKNFNDLEIIKNNILEKNKNTLEWMSIKNVGMTYEIRVQERIINKEKEEPLFCNIISKKEGLITKIYSSKGEIKVNTNDLVKKGDILISGNIILNEETKSSVCASGAVYAKVWYNTDITLRRTYKKKIYTKKSRINFSFRKKTLRKRKYIFYDKQYIIKTKLFTLYKEKEYINKTYKYNNIQSEKKALKELNNKFNDKLNNKGKIIEEKVLKKDINNSTIYISAFVVTEEVISETQK